MLEAVRHRAYSSVPDTWRRTPCRSRSRFNTAMASAEGDANRDPTATTAATGAPSATDGVTAVASSALTELSKALADVKLTVPSAPARFLQLDFLSDAAAASASATDDDEADLARGPLPLAAGPVFRAPVLRSERLTSPAALKTVWSVTLDASGLDGKVEAGDTVGVLCPNTEQDVHQVLFRVGAEETADQPCRVSVLSGTTKKAARVPAHLDTGGTLRCLLTHRVDLRAVPKKPLLLALAGYAAEERERRRLQELASRQGGAEYLEVVRSGGVTTLQMLAAFPSCRPPLEVLLEHLPALPPRPYSASSCPRVNNNTLRIIFSVVESPHRGLCTGWLDDLLRAERSKEVAALTIPLYRRRPGLFRLPESEADAARPLLMVAAGTGLAPLAGMLQERRVRRLSGPAWLVFGCRSQQHDYLLRDELEAAQRDGALTRLDVVFSRAGGPQRYVQHVLKEESERLGRWLLDDAAFMFVCGDAKGMAAGVLEEVVEAVAEAKGVTVEKARGLVKQMQKDGQYRQDVWS